MLSVIILLIILYIASLHLSLYVKYRHDKKKKDYKLRKFIYFPLFIILVTGGMIISFGLLAFKPFSTDFSFDFSYVAFLGSTFLTLGLTMVIYTESQLKESKNDTEVFASQLLSDERILSIFCTSIMNKFEANRKFNKLFAKQLTKSIDKEQLIIAISKELASDDDFIEEITSTISISGSNIEKEIAKSVSEKLRIDYK